MRKAKSESSGLESINRRQTTWEGLWWHPEYNSFSSAALSLDELRKFKGNVRLYVRKNSFYNNGENGRPNYVFCLKDANSGIPRPLEIDVDEEEVEDEDDGERLYTEEEVMSIIHGMEIEYGLSYGNNLISDYIN